MPFRFLDDIATADVAFEAWGKTREELFAAGADALLSTMVHDPEAVERREETVVTVEDTALDLLLFSFLQELVFLKDARRRLLHPEKVRIAEEGGRFRLESVLRGEKIDRQRHPLVVDVKAATLHRLRVACESGIWRAVVVLDV
ncbi:archease [Oryzomonas japonica]|uniref:Archease n=1 Tax=Oryzomonas japonica TaxID=2603858 RepID=A0A7J4ZRT3_9BACT|nr:archease [Oryzomonas japonica]KAB0666008.1 archease [Oryzomonas japonica]